jgi:hypothetical protein
VETTGNQTEKKLQATQQKNNHRQPNRKKSQNIDEVTRGQVVPLLYFKRDKKYFLAEM